MYNLLQLSLKEYKLRNNSTTHDIYFTLCEFDRGEYIEVIELFTLEPSSSHSIIIPKDGVYRLVITTQAEILATFIINNITDLLKKKQEYLTQILLRPNLDKCDHNQYYDIIAFNIIFDNYNKLVKDTYTQVIIPEEQLYKIDYLLKRLKEY